MANDRGPNRTRKIGFWLEPNDRALMDCDLRTLRGVHAYAATHGWDVYVNEIRMGTSRWFRNLAELRDFGAHGLILSESGKLNLSRDQLPSIPTVAVLGPLLDQSHPMGPLPPGVPNVLPDNHLVGRAAAEHLLHLGYQSFAYFAPSARDLADGIWEDPMYWARARADGFVERLAEAGFVCSIYLEEKLYGPLPDSQAEALREHQQRVRKWLTGLPKPIAVMACGDRRGRLLLEACANVSLSVPRDVAVISASNRLFYCELVQPAMTSVDLGYERLGYEAAQALDKLIDGSTDVPGIIKVPPAGVVARASTEVQVIEDESVARALRFIRDKYRDPISVGDVARHVHLSTRQLERRFRSRMGFTMVSEIRRLRIERAKKLLRETDLRQDEIALASGFATSQYMSRIFRGEVGSSPGEWRKNRLVG